MSKPDRPDPYRVHRAVREFIESHERGENTCQIKTVLVGETEVRMFQYYVAAYIHEQTGVWSVAQWEDVVVPEADTQTHSQTVHFYDHS